MMLGRSPSWRAAMRIARRDAWRNKGRNALVALLVAVPVLGVSVVDVLARTGQLDATETVAVQLGPTAQATVSDYGGVVSQSPSGDSASSTGDGETRTYVDVEKAFAAALPARDTLVRVLDWGNGPRLRIGDRSVYVGWREVDASALVGVYDVVDGALPTVAGEVAIGQRLGRDTGLDVGDTITVPQAARTAGAAGGKATLTVTGVVRQPFAPYDTSLIGAPGTLLPPALDAERAYASWYVVGPNPVTWDDVLALNDLGAFVTSRAVLLDPPSADRVPPEARDIASGSGTTTSVVAVVSVSVALCLLQIALLAGPALAVGARRNQRMLAVVVSTGGDRKHARRIVLANGLVVGAVASALAAALGAAAGAGLAWWLIRRGDLTAPGVDVAPLDLLGLVLVGGLTAMAAALVPARQAARLDVVAALTGRRPPEGVRKHVPILGAVVAAVGVAMSLYGAATRSVVVLVLGIGLSQIGFVGMSGAVVALAARLGRRLSLAPRMAVRDAARQRGRTAPAVAAVMAAISGGLAALLYIAAQDAHDRAAYQPQAAAGSVQVGFASDIDLEATASEADRAAAERVLRAELPLADLMRQQVLVDAEGRQLSLSPQPPPEKACPVFDEPLTAAQEKVLVTDPRCNPVPPEGVTFFYVADLVDGTGAALSAVVGPQDPADVAALKAGRVLVPDDQAIRPDGTVEFDVVGTTEEREATKVRLPAAVAVSESRSFQTVIPASLVAKIPGARVADAGLLGTTTRMPTGAEVERATAGLEDLALDASPYLTVERGYVSDYALGLLALVGAALAIALVGSLTAVGLARAESRQDAATLAAVGASPGLRRRMAASQAAVVVLLGTLLGTLAGTLTGWCLVRLQNEPTASFAPEGAVFFESQAAATWVFTVPWGYVALLLVGVPALAIALAFVTTRSRVEVVRQPVF